VTWHVAVVGTGPYTVEWTINGTVYTSGGVDFAQTLAGGKYVLTQVLVTDGNGLRALSVGLSTTVIVT